MSKLIEVQINENQNPQQRKFQFGFPISTKVVVYENSIQAQRSSLATKIFGFPWTEKVEVGTDFVVVQKQDWVDWDILAEPLAGLIKEHFEMKHSGGDLKFEENPELPKATNVQPTSNDPIVNQIQRVLEQEINPMVASHGGKISLVDVQGDTAFVKLEGGCQGCSSSQATLRQGVEVAIKRSVPSIQSVIDVTDHGSGENPYM